MRPDGVATAGVADLGVLMGEIQSPPAFTEETVTDLDVGFASGEVRSFTLRSGDSLRHTDDALLLTIGSPAEVIQIYTRQVAWVSERSRTVKTPIALKPEMAEAIPAGTKLTRGGLER